MKITIPPLTRDPNYNKEMIYITNIQNPNIPLTIAIFHWGDGLYIHQNNTWYTDIDLGKNLQQNGNGQIDTDLITDPQTLQKLNNILQEYLNHKQENPCHTLPNTP